MRTKRTTLDFLSSERLLLVAPILAALIRLAGVVFPYRRVWGFDYLEDFGFPWDVAWTALVFIPPAIVFFSRRGGNDSRQKKRADSLAWVIYPLAAALAVLVPMETFFYGDGGLLVPQIHRLAHGESVDFGVLLNVKSSPLAGLLVYGGARLIPDVFSWFGIPLPTTAAYPFSALSAVALLALGVFFFAYRREREIDTARILAPFCTAGILLFFGYVEFYVVVYALVAMFAILGERYVGGRGRTFPLVLVYVGAVAAHYESLAFLPAFLFAYFSRRMPSFSRQAFHSFRFVVPCVLLAIGAAYFVFGFAWKDSRIVMPFFPVTTPAGTLAYTLFSSYHLIDLANILLLLAPSALLVVLLTPLTGRTPLSPAARFHAVAAASFFLFLVFANTSLGLARDWDIATPLGIPLTFLALAVIRDRAPHTWRTSGAAFASASILFFLPWVLLHLDPAMSARRFERILPLDAGHMYRDYTLSGYESLRKFYQHRGDEEKDIALTMKNIEILDYPSQYALLIAKTAALAGRDPVRAARLYTWTLGRLHAHATLLRKTGRERDYAISLRQIDSLAEAVAFSAYTNKLYADVRENVEAVSALTGSQRPYSSVAALAAWEERDYKQAACLLEQTLARGFREPRVYLFLGNALAILGRYTESLRVLESGVREFPEDPMLSFTLGKYLVSAGRAPDIARSLLISAIELGLPPEREREARSFLERLGPSP
ncbi:MAG: tetratricopeptide repeat protein [Bacteroidota bacterium]|nr:tetratricopeptide repeat protein [Bacteroidota bacterium]